LQFFVFLNDFIRIKYDANSIVEFVWRDEFFCYALSGVILEVVADGERYPDIQRCPRLTMVAMDI
jgi:hypothetical protein